MSISPSRRGSRARTAPDSTSSSSTLPRMAAATSLAMLLLTGGCAFADLSVSPPSSSSVAPTSNIGRGREIVLETPFADQRLTRDRCGMQKNGYNMDTASVYCTVPPSEWLSQALEQGLVNAGFHVRTQKQAQSSSAVRINGAVLQFFVEPEVGAITFTPEADISLKLIVTSQSGLRAERVFYVKGVETSLVGTEENFQKATDASTTQAVTAMVGAIGSLLDRYPQLGVPEGNGPVAVSSLSGKEAGR